MCFQPGQSGNPSGKPKTGYDSASQCRKHGARVLRVLVELRLLRFDGHGLGSKKESNDDAE
jgi:hypothetical protein